MLLLELGDIVSSAMDDDPITCLSVISVGGELEKTTSSPCHCCVWPPLRHSISAALAAYSARRDSFGG